jgi:hypothetical protein
MGKFIILLLLKIIINPIINYCFNEENKKIMVEKLNDNIDIPIINEKTEAKYIEAILDTVQSAARIL